jgi:hypothetical protein
MHFQGLCLLPEVTVHYCFKTSLQCACFSEDSEAMLKDNWETVYTGTPSRHTHNASP